ncbi:MAG: M23 family metallopeptidase [SAR86 cluster bacterium]|nr:M23 family metallopeptidase [SAR86 cluster bacterium]
MVNYKVDLLSFDYDSKNTSTDDQLLCIESSNQLRIIKPIPLSYKDKTIRVKINFDSYKDFLITPKEYRISKIEITNNDFNAPSKDNLIRASKERALISEIINYNSSNVFFSDLRMRLPVEGIISSEFGVRRYINGTPRSNHLGTDIVADTGTAIKAPMAGKVLLIGNFFYRGKVIFIDHGQGLISSYSHLNKINVRKNQKVIPGTTLGEVGQTGRVTGPHLHWQIYLKGTSIDPEIFLL